MGKQKTSSIEVRGLGGYLPGRVVTNEKLSETLETSDEWILERTGICQRHLVDEETTSDLAVQAGKRALEAAGVGPEEVGIIIVATVTPDHTFPATAMRVQQRLGAVHALAFDISAACSGFLFALQIVSDYMRSAEVRYGLVIGAETMSHIVDWQDRGTAILFGDGAGAMLLEKCALKEEEEGLLATYLCADGNGYDELYVNGGPGSCGTSGVIIMNGREVFRRAVQCMEQASRQVLEKAQVSIDDVNWVVPHQANKRITDVVARKLGVGPERLIITGAQHANTSAASIPLALWQAQQDGRLRKNDLVLLQAFGAGFTWGACLLRI